MKRNLELMVLGIIGLLLSAAPAFAPVPVAEHHSSGMTQPLPLPASAAGKPAEALVLTASHSTGLSRADHPLHHGISAESLIPGALESHRFVLAEIPADSAHEAGFDSFRRAPPVPRY